MEKPSWIPKLSKVWVIAGSAALVTCGWGATGIAAPVAVPADVNIFSSLAKKAVPSVVNISTPTGSHSPFAQAAPDDPFRRFFEEYFGHGGGGGRPPRRMPPRGEPRAMALGTGFVIDSSGLIVTNNHVVENADEIKIAFTEDPSEKPVSGEVVGRDAEMDVAIIQVKTDRKLVPLSWGDSDALEVGEYVMAVGNPFGQGHSVTHGIISAKGRALPELPFASYLQTDTAINPGNSGGPLLNLKGEVIGINNAIDARAQGIGFAIPSNAVKSIIPQLRDKGKVSRGSIGVVVTQLSPEIADQIGAPNDLLAPIITQVNAGSPAERAGLKPYDVVLAFNEKKVSTSSDLVVAVSSVKVGESAPMKILRNGKEKTLTLKTAERAALTAQSGREEGRGDERRRKTPGIDLGMDVRSLSPELARQFGISGEAKGALVTSVEYGSPADRAGLQQGDLVVEADRKKVDDADDLLAALKSKKSYLLRIRRGEAYAVIVLDLKG